jgi:GPH family glycoside/pentoside/hexuronide:cation symporter
MFSVPSSFVGTVQLVYMFLTYNLVSTIFYTGINVPYATLNGLMTTNQYERGLLGNFRNLLATAGTMTINTVVLKMTGFFGNGDPYTQKGWTLTIAILMVVFIALNMMTFAFCRERVVEEGVSDGNGKEENVSFLKGFQGLFKNKYWVMILILILAMYFMMSCFFGSAAYFAQYAIGDVNKYTIISNCLSVAQIACLFVTPFIMKVLSKRNVFIVGSVITLAGFLLSGFTTNVALTCVFSVMKGMGFACGGATMYGMLQDSITYGEWYNGYGTAGMGNAASSFGMKVGSGIGTAALGWILSAGGFDAVQAGGAVTSSVLTSINWAFAFVPAICMVIVLVCLLFFDLDKHYDQVVADLQQGKHRLQDK